MKITGLESPLGVLSAEAEVEERFTLGRAQEIANLAGVTTIRYNVRSRDERWALTRVSTEGKIERHVAQVGGLKKLLAQLVQITTKELLA